MSTDTANEKETPKSRTYTMNAIAAILVSTALRSII